MFQKERIYSLPVVSVPNKSGQTRKIYRLRGSETGTPHNKRVVSILAESKGGSS